MAWTALTLSGCPAPDCPDVPDGPIGLEIFLPLRSSTAGFVSTVSHERDRCRSEGTVHQTQGHHACAGPVSKHTKTGGDRGAAEPVTTTRETRRRSRRTARTQAPRRNHRTESRARTRKTSSNQERPTARPEDREARTPERATRHASPADAARTPRQRFLEANSRPPRTGPGVH